MRTLIYCTLILLSSAAIASEKLLLKNVTIVSPELTTPQKKRHVVIIDGRISDIAIKSPSEKAFNKVIDGTGKFLVPGIMDSHVHVSSIPGMGFGAEEVSLKYPALASAYFHQQPQSFLYYGVTQVLDPNPGKNWHHFVEANNHPDYLRCEVITSKTTFPYVEKSSDVGKRMFDYLVEEAAEPSAVNSPESLVSKIAQSGAVCIKLYFENGYGNNDQWPLLSQSTLKRIKRAAVEKKLTLLAHANAYDMYQKAIEAKVDVLAHGMWNWGKYSRSGELSDAIRFTLQEIKRKGIGFMATQRVIAGLGEVMLLATKNNLNFQKTTPQALIDWYQTSEAEWFSKELIAGFDGMPASQIADVFLYGRVAKGQKVIQYLDQQKHPLLIASDFPGSPSYANQPGLTTYQEMVMMADAGISLNNILAAATINNARQFNIAHDYGTIEVGKIANLLLLKENPLVTIEAWDSIEKIVLHGNVLEREMLRADQ